MPDPGTDNALRKAVDFFQQGRPDLAEAPCAQVLRRRPNDPDALHLLGTIRGQQGRLAEAVELLTRAANADPRRAEAHRLLGLALFGLGRHDEALASFARAVSDRPDHLAALANLADAQRKLGRHADALATYDRALALRPADPDALSGRGMSLIALGRDEEAAICFERVLAARPEQVDAWVNRGSALRRTGRFEAALSCFDRALALRPDFRDARFLRALALQQLGRNEQAVAEYDRILAAKPDDAAALNNRGNTLRWLNRYDEALASFDRALAIEPGHANALPSAAHLRRMICDWRTFAATNDALLARVRAGGPAMDAFPLLSVTDDGALLHAAGRQFWLSRRGAPTPLPPPPAHDRDRVRLGYLSADFRLHPVAMQLVRLFEAHDRSRFEVLGLSYGADDGSALRRRLEQAFDSFHDLRALGPPDMARRIRELEVDILIDLTGYMTDTRVELLAWRPAPVQVHYFGYPGPMGCDAIDYMLVDPFIVPPAERAHYSEKLVVLPDCYMVSDGKRAVAEPTPDRADCGLPPDGFVFCSFNNNYKITPAVFDIWMRLLHAVPGGVLWLLADNRWAEDNLRREAAARGVDAGRLVFAPRRPPPEHLARIALADLFLDSLPYNAHVTASDALAMGLPVLTCVGRSFAARVAGSLLRNVGLAELVTESLADYEALALTLAREPARLKALRDRLAAARTTASHFDIERMRRPIESAYLTMIERWRQGLPPEAFSVA
jgi:predicted O-linked N-acetylglucosamine transferase (SPINDLY family)